MRSFNSLIFASSASARFCERLQVVNGRSHSPMLPGSHRRGQSARMIGSSSEILMYVISPLDACGRERGCGGRGGHHGIGHFDASGGRATA